MTQCEKSPEQEKPKPLDTSWVACLFAKMQVRYGHKWTSNLPTPELQRLAVREWAECLSGYTGEEIKRGLDATKKSPWPPSTAEFMLACRPPVARQHPSHKLYPALPKPKQDPAIREEALEKMRRGSSKLQ